MTGNSRMLENKWEVLRIARNHLDTEISRGEFVILLSAKRAGNGVSLKMAQKSPK